MFFSTIAATFWALSSVSNAAIISRKRDVAVPVPLHAYGRGISGLQVYFCDNLAYLGDPKPLGTARTSNLTFSTTPNNTVSVTSPENKWAPNYNPVLFINPNAFTQVGFAFPNETIAANMTTTGFAFYGDDLGWYSDNTYGNFELMFWATPTPLDGLYNLVWNPDSSIYTTGTPVSLRSV